MGSFVANADCFVIRCQTSDKVRQEMTGLDRSHQEMINFIIDAAKQMAAFVQTDYNESRILRTPSRRTSKRKRSSVAAKLVSPKASMALSVSKRGVSSAFKTRELFPTPRRMSKRTKRSTIKLDTTVEDMEVDLKGVEEKGLKTLNNNECEDNERNGENLSVIIDKVVDNQKTVEEDNEVMSECNENTIQNDKNDVMKATVPSELMSELSINEKPNTIETKIDNKLNESENEWMTDDEDGPQKKETEVFFDAMDVKEKESNREAKQKANSSVVSAANKTLTATSAVKSKRKKSLYFTPQTTQRSTRAQTRMLSRIADSAQKTPQTASMADRRKDSSQTSGSGSAKPVTGGSSARSMRSYSRIQTKSADNKAMTASAQKRRQEAEEERLKKLMASQEKEKKAMEKRRVLMAQAVNEKKLKSQEKANRAAELRELNRQKDMERAQKERERREERERTREEERREAMRRKQEEMALKTREAERRKQMQEMREKEEKQRKQEELTRKMELDRERQREQDRLAAMIQQHNNSLQQKALANSFIKKYESNSQLMPKVMVNRLSPIEVAKHLTPTEAHASAEPVPPKTTDQTFVVEAKDESSYDMTPPPKEHDYDNYDISEIQSGDDTDDEQQPRKRIPPWARGQMFIKRVHSQYSQSNKALSREVKRLFGPGDTLLTNFKVDFDLMFSKKPLHPKYAKRTSSAVWDSPPQRYRMNESSINESFL